MSQITFHFLNVGKGNCTIIDFPSGRLSVVDIDDSRALSRMEKLAWLLEKKEFLTNPVDYITSQFPNREIFRFILTHPDMDHMSGIKSLFNQKYVRYFWDTDNNRPDPGNWDQSFYDKEDWQFYEKLHQKKINNITYIRNLRNDTSSCCWVQDGIKILAPTEDLVKEANENEDWDSLSYVLMIEYAKRKILLGGDATKKSLEDIKESYDKSYLKSDVLFVPHHGSPNHISKEILDVINPNLTVVSVAEGVDYARELYSSYGIVLSTKYYGNIWVKIKDTGKIIFTTQFQNYSDGWYRLKTQF
jgi:competence protein ComEC